VTRCRLLSGLIVFALIAAGAPAGASDLEAQLADVGSRIDGLTGQIDDANASRPALVNSIVSTRDRLSAELADLQAARQALAVVESDRAAREARLAHIRADLQATYERLASTRTELGDARQAARDWARELYMGSRQASVDVAFGVAEVTEMLVGLEYLNVVAEGGNRSLRRYESLQAQEQRERDRIAQQEREVADEVAALVAIEARLEELEDEHLRKAAVLESEVAALRSGLDSLDAEIATFEGELAGLEKEQERVEQLIAQEASREGTAPSILVRPVPGPITSAFGLRMHPILGFVRMHTGVDMEAPWGQSVAAGAAGRVIFAGPYGGYGNTVIIDHEGGMSTLSAHLSSFAVVYGEQVSAGQTVGYVGSTGLSTGPHLHFEVRIDGKPVDPAPYLAQGGRIKPARPPQLRDPRHLRVRDRALGFGGEEPA